MARAEVNAFKPQLKNQRRPDTAHRAEFLKSRLANDAVYLFEFFVGQPRVRLGKRNELQSDPHACDFVCGAAPRGGSRLFGAALRGACLRLHRLAFLNRFHHRLRLGGISGSAVPHRKGVIGIQHGPSPVTGLGIDQHAIDGHGLNLPLPPESIGLNTAGAVGGVKPLQHEALHAPRARFGAQVGKRLPGHQPLDRRQFDPGTRQQLLKHQPALTLQHGPQILPGKLQQVVGHEGDRCIGEYFFTQRLAPYALLQQCKTGRPPGTCQRSRRSRIVSPHHDFPVEHGAVRQGLRESHDFGKTLGHQFLAT